MKDNRRTILKQILNGTMAGHTAAKELQTNGKTEIYVAVEGANGLYSLNDEKGLTEAKLNERLAQISSYGLMRTITIE